MPQYYVYSNGGQKFRNGIRDGYYVTDITLTVTGFVGAENTDWMNIDKTSLDFYPDGTPSGLALTVISHTEIQLDWTAGSTNHDGHSIERSPDNATWSEIATVTGATVHYHNTGLTAGTLYYYRVRAYKGTLYSSYSNTDSDTIWASEFKITIDTTKAGSANNTFILPTAGAGYTYDYYVDWGDGSAESHVVINSSQTKVYAASGTYQIKIRGTFPYILFANGGDKLKLMSIDNWGNISWTNFGSSFYGCSNMQGTYTDKPNLSSVTTLTNMFRGCSSFSSSVSWNTSTIESFHATFLDCTTFNQPVPFDTTACRDMSFMFSGCSVFNQSVASFDTSNVDSWLANHDCGFKEMFSHCYVFNQSVSNFDTSKVTVMWEMFNDCYVFNQPVPFDTTACVDMTNMFTNCRAFNQSVATFDTSNVEDIAGMFQEAWVFNQSVSNFDTSLITDMHNVFYNAKVFNQSIDAWDTSNVTDFTAMFLGAVAFKQDLVSNDISAATTMTQMFQGVDINATGTTTNYDNTLIAWEALSVQNSVTFNGGSSKYSSYSSAETARTNLKGTHSWTITDGGGTECIANGGFADGSKWTAATGWTISGGKANYDDVTNGASLKQIGADNENTILRNTNYDLTFTISGAATAARIYILDSAGGNVYIASTSYANGTHVLNFTTPSAGSGIAFYAYTTGDSFSIDNISLIEHV